VQSGIRASFSHFLDVASEEVACTSGVLLSDANIRRLAIRYRIDEFRGITRNECETVLRAEELEEAILGLRVAIGELPDTKMGQFFIVDAAKMIWINGGNPRGCIFRNGRMKIIAEFRNRRIQSNVSFRWPCVNQRQQPCATQ
jgi:hypothetical protein